MNFFFSYIYMLLQRDTNKFDAMRTKIYNRSRMNSRKLSRSTVMLYARTIGSVTFNQLQEENPMVTLLCRAHRRVADETKEVGPRVESLDETIVEKRRGTMEQSIG